MPQSVRKKDTPPPPSSGLGLTSDRALQRMVDRLRTGGIQDERVLVAMQAVPRHLFVDEAFASRAYEDAALPIGHRQTISSPVTVAKMLALLMAGGHAGQKVLEVGAGCGYQAAVLSRLFASVTTIERLESLHIRAAANLTKAGIKGISLLFGDGMQGCVAQAPFDAIVVAAAGIQVPEALMQQLAVGGRMVLPVVQGGRQVLAVIDRTGPARWVTENKDIVNFVPLLQGTVAR
jgi:protein-L-isoaspartate(D-aspartate) O-methyltransferase